MKREYKGYVLHILMLKCLDFAEEQSAMEYLLSKLRKKAGEHEFRILTFPKYHCKLAGAGVKYVLGLAKQFYWSKTIQEKKMKKKLVEYIIWTHMF